MLLGLVATFGLCYFPSMVYELFFRPRYSLKFEIADYEQQDSAL